MLKCFINLAVKMPVEAERVWRLLNGLMCVYKPSGVSWKYVMFRIKKNLCKDLNSMETRPVKDFFEVQTTDGNVVTKVRPSYADSVLCVGPRYQHEDIYITFPSPLDDLASGVLGINNGDKISNVLKQLHFTKCYHLKGILGQATSNFHIDERVVARGKYEHVNADRFEKTLAFYQSRAQRSTFEEYGFTLTSEEAYDFATRGLYRPDKHKIPIAYSLKLIDFKPPEFTLEVQCINETQVYLMNLIHNLGISLKSYATCTGLRCLRQGYFRIEHALLKKYWTADHIVDNIKLCYKILQEDYPKKLMFSPTVTTLKRVQADE